jgi:hypothetical protein
MKLKALTTNVFCKFKKLQNEGNLVIKYFPLKN